MLFYNELLLLWANNCLRFFYESINLLIDSFNLYFKYEIFIKSCKECCVSSVANMLFSGTKIAQSYWAQIINKEISYNHLNKNYCLLNS